MALSFVGEANTLEGNRSFESNGAPVDDITLIAAAKRGHARAFENLVQRYNRRLFAIAKRITRNREDAEDVVQQSFQKAFLYLDRFQGKSRFSTWLTRIVMNEALMLLRHRQSSRKVFVENSSDEQEALPLDATDYRPNPEEDYARREQKRMVAEAINQLAPKVRKAIWLHYIQELSLKEMARRMGTSIPAAKGRIFHGRRKLRPALNDFAMQS
jgi:RNA polymerase sigma-70 factor (ECF subfamily)